MKTLKQIVVIAVATGMIVVALPRPTAHATTIARGSSSSQGAAKRTQAPSYSSETSLRDGWQRAFAHSDTTGYEFPDEVEERTTWSLVKDVVLWLAVAGFVAFFIVQVFLTGDDDAPPEDEGGKEIPPTVNVNWRAAPNSTF